MGESQINLYESQALREVVGPVIRPGGFELTERGLSHCRLVPGARVLDVGCGTGVVVDYIRQKYGLAAVGIDFSSVLLEEGIRTYVGSPLVRGRAEQLPAADGIFEAVLCECVLSLCRQPLNVLREIRRVMQAGGYLVLSDVYTRDPAAPAWSAKPSIHSCLLGAVDKKTVLDRVADAGYELLMWEDHSPLLKQLAAQLAWTYGSLDDFWSAVGGSCAAGAMGTNRTGACVWPGYFLLVARKR
ncbi:MAG: class I SAM-dependent methyltransferase [Desulfobacteraceae bacterium]